MIMDNQILCTNTSTTSSPPPPPPPITMHKNSQTISKTKPKIRIIHIFAPEIIKTDAANFRELVQRLTGKPTEEGGLSPPPETKVRVSRKREGRIFSSSKKMEVSRFHAEFRERVKEEEEEIWRGANSGGGFLGGLGEFDGFMHELSHLPFLEGTTPMPDVVYGEC